MNQRTRIKICGLTRLEDILAAVEAGVDAIGFVFYEKSARYISPENAAKLVAHIPPFITTVGLFVNASAPQVQEVIKQVPLSLLQFHGDESPELCTEIAHSVNRPYIRALRVKVGMDGEDLVKYQDSYQNAAGILLDTFVDTYGGSGKTFDWSIVTHGLLPHGILSGGLTPANVASAIKQITPYAVDVSSGVEVAPGVKDAQLINDFVHAVRLAKMDID